MLTTRRETILRIIVGDYIDTAVPVGSQAVALKYKLGISPATIRNEMAQLEEGGYVTHLHTSAGRVPSDKGYRYYVESLMEEPELPPGEQLLLRHQFHQIGRELEEWTRLAAAMLSRLVHNAALITVPKGIESRLKHLQLVSLQEYLALVVIVLQEARLKQQILPLEEAASQEQLTALANRLNSYFSSKTRRDIVASDVVLSPPEEQVALAVLTAMQAEDEARFGDVYLEGLRLILNQPEFSSVQRMRDMVEVLEDKSLWRNILPQVLTGEGITVVIGGENREDAMRQCSVILSLYGAPGDVSGAIGVVGPTRMEYGKAISAVRYLAALMGELTGGLGR